MIGQLKNDDKSFFLLNSKKSTNEHKFALPFFLNTQHILAKLHVIDLFTQIGVTIKCWINWTVINKFEEIKLLLKNYTIVNRDLWTVCNSTASNFYHNIHYLVCIHWMRVLIQKINTKGTWAIQLMIETYRILHRYFCEERRIRGHRLDIMALFCENLDAHWRWHSTDFWFQGFCRLVFDRESTDFLF